MPVQVVEGVQLEEGLPPGELPLAQLVDLRDRLAQAQGELVSEPLVATESGEFAFPW